jgi:hypothetical protein
LKRKWRRKVERRGGRVDRGNDRGEGRVGSVRGGGKVRKRYRIIKGGIR